ncbi:hypothetical protein ACFX13_047099 [Malus domestica]
MEDARKAVEVGVAGIVVSNHGGRQFDCTPPTISVLDECNSINRCFIISFFLLRNQLESCMIRCSGGSCCWRKRSCSFRWRSKAREGVFKALTLGAQTVLVGRLVIYGLAAGGGRGVRRVIEMLEDEFELTMALSCCPSVKDITRSHVRTLGDHKLFDQRNKDHKLNSML